MPKNGLSLTAYQVSFGNQQLKIYMISALGSSKFLKVFK